MSDDLSNYRFYFVLAYENVEHANNANFVTGFIPTNETTQLLVVTTYIAYRRITAISGNKMTFENGRIRTSYGMSEGGIYNNTVIPVKIWGVK